MVRTALLSAVATGAFCSVFTVFVDTVADTLELWTVVILSFVSGFLGSLFARAVLGRSS